MVDTEQYINWIVGFLCIVLYEMKMNACVGLIVLGIKIMVFWDVKLCEWSFISRQ